MKDEKKILPYSSFRIHPSAFIPHPLLKWLRRLLTTPAGRSGWEFWLWFTLAFGFALVYALVGVRKAFKNPYIIQSDARQVIVWLERFIDPELFPGDIIADYYTSALPAGFTAVYKVAALAGISPIYLSKILPVLLGLATSAFCFGVSMRILPVPAAGFISTVLLNQCLWTDDSLMSATPRAFLYPLFLAFLYYLMSGRAVLTLTALALAGLFYPPIMLISVGVLVLRLFEWRGGRPALTRDRREYALCAVGVVVACAILFFYARASSQSSPTITAKQALALPSSLAGKRLDFLRNPNRLDFWLTEGQSGMVARKQPPPPLIFVGLFLPVLWFYRKRLPLAGRISDGVKVLPRILVAAVFLFFAAHALLFKLYLPNRYTIHIYPMVLSLAAAVTMTVFFDYALDWAGRGGVSYVGLRKVMAIGLIVTAAAALVLFPSYAKRFPHRSWVIGESFGLYDFFSHEPKDCLIATLSAEANYLPAFAKRSVLVGDHFANPYQVDYYLELTRRYSDLLNAHYSQDIGELRSFIEKYGVDFIVIDREAFTSNYVMHDRVIKRFDAAAEISARLERGEVPALSMICERCGAYKDKHFVVARADCILRQSESNQSLTGKQGENK
jgi:hypothetical protein